MKRDNLIPTMLILLAGLLLLIIAGALDYALFRLRLHVNSTFELWHVLFLLTGFSALVVAALSWGVASLALTGSRPRRPIGLLFSLLGLAAAFSPLLVFQGWLNWSPLPVPSLIGEHLRLAGALLTVLGVVLIVKPVSDRSEPCRA